MKSIISPLQPSGSEKLLPDLIGLDIFKVFVIVNSQTHKLFELPQEPFLRLLTIRMQTPVFAHGVCK